MTISIYLQFSAARETIMVSTSKKKSEETLSFKTKFQGYKSFEVVCEEVSPQTSNVEVNIDTSVLNSAQFKEESFISLKKGTHSK